MNKAVKPDSECAAWRIWPYAATLAVVLGVSLVNDTLSNIRGGDASSYLLLAKSIASGYGLADINLPGAPPHTQYPPVLPLILAPVTSLFGYNFVMMRLLMLVFSYGAVYMAGRFFERIAGVRVATAMAFLLATNFYFLFFARELMTEVPYAFFLLLVLYFTMKYDERDGVREYVLILPALVALTYMTRMIGITLYAAVVVALVVSCIEKRADAVLRRRALIRLLCFGAAGIVPFALWSVRNAFFAGDVATYQSIFFRADYYSLDAGAAGVGAMVERFFHNSWYYIQSIPRSVITSADLKEMMPPGFLTAVSIALLLIILLGLARELWVKRGVKDFYFLFYFALLTVWPVYGIGDARRYVVPMIPLVYYYLVVGLAVLLGWRQAFARSGVLRLSAVALPVCIVLLPINLYEIRALVWPPSTIERLEYGGRTIKNNLFARVDLLTPAGAGAGYFEEAAPCFANYLYASELLAKAMAPGDVVMARKAEITHLLSGRYVVRFPYTADHSEMQRFVTQQGVTHILLDACYRETDAFVVPYVNSRPGGFEVMADDKMGTAILRIKKRGDGGGADPRTRLKPTPPREGTTGRASGRDGI